MEKHLLDNNEEPAEDYEDLLPYYRQNLPYDPSELGDLVIPIAEALPHIVRMMLDDQPQGLGMLLSIFGESVECKAEHWASTGERVELEYQSYDEAHMEAQEHLDDIKNRKTPLERMVARDKN